MLTKYKLHKKFKVSQKSKIIDVYNEKNPEKKIIEYMLEDKSNQQLINMNLAAFSDETAAESPAPGGGSISAYVGALGISLGTMVANLSANKRGWDDKVEGYSTWAVKGQELRKSLLQLVDEDTMAFNRIMEAFGLPKTYRTISIY